ncbi:MAG: DUF167 domain-containing protein [Anaerolineales bacterium]
MRKFDFQFQDAKKGAAITVKVTPRAKKTEVVGLMEDGTIRIRVAAPPAEGAANAALIDFLAEALNLSKSQIDIVAGASAERKLISLTGITPSEVDTVINQLAQASEKSRAAKIRSDHKAAKSAKKSKKKK